MQNTYEKSKVLEWFPFIQGAGDLGHKSPSAFNNSGSGKGQALNTLSHFGFCFSTASTAHSFSAAIYFLRVIVNTPVNAMPTSLAIVPPNLAAVHSSSACTVLAMLF